LENRGPFASETLIPRIAEKEVAKAELALTLETEMMELKPPEQLQLPRVSETLKQADILAMIASKPGIRFSDMAKILMTTSEQLRPLVDDLLAEQKIRRMKGRYFKRKDTL
jgi:DNA-binding MarR family transcriptional regulator